VNLGSDHPSIIEAIVKGQNEKKGQFPRIITCPNEMVALSMADGKWYLYEMYVRHTLTSYLHFSKATLG
jgi:hypothetical protein